MKTIIAIRSLGAPEVPNESVLELFKNMPWCQEGALWEEEADLRDALIYVRGSKLLKIPEVFRDVLPKNI